MLAGFPPFHAADPQTTYKQVLSGRTVLPRHLEPSARDLLRSGLLIDDQLQRLGMCARALRACADTSGLAVAWVPPYLGALPRDTEAPYVFEGVWGASDVASSTCS